MKKIYIVLTYTGTFLSRIIKSYTKDEFSHISISLDAELNQMYSFGRLTPYTPLIAGFVHEYKNKGTYKRFYNTRSKIYSLDVTEEQYENISNNIRNMESNKEIYKFNIIGLFAAGFHKTIKKERYFYCAEFVKYLFEEANIDADLPNPVRPEDFKSIIGLREVYKGLLRKYNFSELDRISILDSNVFIHKQESLS